MGLILHVTLRADWEMAQRKGVYESASLATEGFIHCSKLEQAEETANRYFKGQRDVILLCIDEAKVKAVVKYEEPAKMADARDALLFPHIYGPLNLDGVFMVANLGLDSSGRFLVPPEVQSLAI